MGLILSIPSVMAWGSWGHIKILGRDIFSFMDYISSNWLLVLSGLIMTLFIGWQLGIKKFQAMTNPGATKIKIKGYMSVLYRYILPLSVIILLCSGLLP